MKIYWLDLETTGLDPNKHSIIEVAVAEADLLDPFNVTVIHQSVLWYHPAAVEHLERVVIDMHTKNGLFAACAVEENPDTFEVEAELLKLIPFVENKDDRPVLAGSCVNFDHEFLKVHMPKLERRFGHRHFDVSALKLFCQSVGMPKIQKAEAHRAMDDVFESIAHGVECREWLRTNLK